MDKHTVSTSMKLIDGRSESYNQPHDEIFKKNGVAGLKQINNFEFGSLEFTMHYAKIGSFINGLYGYFLDENIDINFRRPVLSEVIKTYNSCIAHIVNIAKPLSAFISLSLFESLDKIALTTKQKIIIAKQILSRIKEQKLNIFSLNEYLCKYQCYRNKNRKYNTRTNIIYFRCKTS